jgi:hypothetical protein
MKDKLTRRREKSPERSEGTESREQRAKSSEEVTS